MSSSAFILPQEKLIQLFENYIKEQKKLITSCGSGITACIIGLGAYMAGHRHITIYDGSWTEWAQDEKRPVQKR